MGAECMYISNINSSSIKISRIEHYLLQTKDSKVLQTEDNLMLIYVKKGQTHFGIDDKDYRCQENDILILNPQQKISFEADKNSEIITILLTGFVFTSSVNLDSVDGHFLVHNRGRTLRHYFDLLLLENESKSRGTDQIIKRLVECIMIYVLRHSDISIKDNGKLAKSKDVQEVQNYIRDHYSEKVTLEQLAEVSDINKFYLIRIFKQNTGLSPIDYLIHVRIEESEKLLIHTDEQIADISAKVGFNSPSHFTKAFRMINHITPSQFRKKHRHP